MTGVMVVVEFNREAMDETQGTPEAAEKTGPARAAGKEETGNSTVTEVGTVGTETVEVLV